jgi:hypothetical protein
MTKANIVPFYIGRPNFDGTIMKAQMDQGWFVTGFPECVTYHLEHPDRLQYARRLRHPDSVYNTQLAEAAGNWAFGNVNLDLRVSRNKLVYRINDVWYDIPADRPDGVWPLTLPKPTETPAAGRK